MMITVNLASIRASLSRGHSMAARALSSPFSTIKTTRKLGPCKLPSLWPMSRLECGARGAPECLRSFQTSPVRKVHPFVIALIKPVSRVLAVVVGRRFRKWWANLPDEQKARLRSTNLRYSRAWGGFGFLLIAFGVYGYVSHLRECPITQRKRFVALTPGQMEKIAQAEFQQILGSFGGNILPDGHPAYYKVARVTRNLLKANSSIEQIRDKKWTITVVDSSERNAFVLPSGNIFVFTGMLEVCQNDHQLGIVLGHEIAHTVLEHAAENLSYVNLLSALLFLPLAVAWAFLPNDGIALIADWFIERVSKLVFELPFSRDMETEADLVGLQLAARSCIDLREAPVFWGRMDLLSNELMKDPNAAEMPEFLSTHPSHAHREIMIAQMLPDALQLRSSCGCPALSSTDPYKKFKQFQDYVRMRRNDLPAPAAAA